MRCYICDVGLSEKEVSLDQDGKSNPCTTCTTIIHETAYADGFKEDEQYAFAFVDEEEVEEDDDTE